MSDWAIDDSSQTYKLENWSEGYVDINDSGHLVVNPYRRKKPGQVDLHQLVAEITEADIALPVLVRFQDILKDRVDTLCDAFSTSFKQHQYDASYTAVYPIKVNQQFSVVQEILQHGLHRVGLEAGSKPELMAVLSLAKPGQHTIICNGYKDREYIRLALIARKLGINTIIVLEKISELKLVLEQADDLSVEPVLGLRLKLASIGRGKWQNTGGEKAKFGLTAEQILQVVTQLKIAGKQQCLKLLHFHMGSQIASLEDIKTGLGEAAQYFLQLHQLGIDINVLDIGGGMGVDYEGSDSSGEFSVNYDVSEYANAVVKKFAEICAQNKITQPDIITESGRAMTAHHAVLITDVVNIERHDDSPLTEKDIEIFKNEKHSLIQNAFSLYEDSKQVEPLRVYDKINALYQQAQSEFVSGNLSIEQRALLEKIYLASSQRLKNNLKHDDAKQQQLLDAINEKLADKMVCNFSVFQSVPDVWGIGQVFPVVPLENLHQQPTRRAIVQDLTCDSDGQIENYVDRYGIETTLPVHDVRDKEKYHLGLFMVGAYQEILGDMHNLFGDTNTVNVRLKEGGHELCDFESGDSVRELLEYVHFNTDEMTQHYKNKIKQAGLSDELSECYLTELMSGLEGYTYLE